MTRRVLLIDDHVAIRTGLQDILGAAIPNLEFGHAADFATGLRMALDESWHLAIIDIDLPHGRSGLDLITSLREADFRTPVLVYTMHAEDQFGIRALRIGAQGYLNKGVGAEEVVKAAQSMLAGQRYISSTLAALMAEALVRHTPESAHETLSEREFAVFRALALGHPIVQIAADLRLSPKTVSTYRSRVLEKLNLKNTSDLVRYAITKKIIK